MTHNLVFSIIIPTRNEKKNLERLLPVLTHLYPHSPIFIVDDDSADGTQYFVRRFSQKNHDVCLLSRKNKRGRGSAVIGGLKQAYKDKKISYFLEMDADLSHDPNEIEKLLEETESRNTSLSNKQPKISILKTELNAASSTNYTIIIGSRHIPGAKFLNCSPLRVFLSKLANWYARFILCVPINDYTNGFRLYPRQAVEVLNRTTIHEQGYITLSETAYILYKKGFSFKEVPTVFVNRKIGQSKTTILEFLHSIPAIVRIRLKH